ncbi:MAG: hypothetical protein II969_03745 [Anaerolineaceae bacterium]|nr:hypothetical protein [Anaerolineaceae bacterium]
MKIRIINENDWEKVYELDKSIIRVGSQVTCDIQLREGSIPPLMMQFVRSGGTDEKHVARFFADNIILTRGDQVFPVSQVTPYDILDGDKFTFLNYRMIVGLEDEKARARTTTHISAELFLTKRDLSLESAINGALILKNLGTEKPCQFRMRISGIPEECVQSAPLPYLYPDSSSTVGFIISHLHTKPAPGFHTVSITVTAPEDYFGEELEFNQDIYVHPVFDNIFTLEDDSQKLSGFNKNQAEALLPVNNTIQTLVIPDTQRLNVDEKESEDEEPVEMPVRIVGSDDAADNNVFNEPEEEEETYKITRKKRPVVVVHNENGDAFDEPDSPAPSQSDNSTPPAKSQAAYMKIESEDSENDEKTSQTEPAESSSEVPAVKKKKRKKKSRLVLNEDTVMVPSGEEEPVRETVEENTEVSVAPQEKEPAAAEPEHERFEPVNLEMPGETVEEKPVTEPAEIMEIPRKKKSRSKRVKKEAVTDDSSAGNEKSMEDTSNTAVDFASEPQPVQTEDSVPASELLSVQTVDSVSLQSEAEKDNNTVDSAAEVVPAEEIPVFRMQTDENNQSDSINDSGNDKIEQTENVEKFRYSMEENGADVPDTFIQTEPEAETNEVQPEVMKISSSETAGADKEETEKQSKPEIVKSFGEDGTVPVAVVSGRGNFDDPAEFPADEILVKPDDAEPEVVVVKGGGFDQ